MKAVRAAMSAANVRHLRQIGVMVRAAEPSEEEILARLEWGRRPMPMQAPHACGHLKGIIWFLRWAAKQPVSFTGAEFKPPHWDDKRWAFHTCQLNGHVERTAAVPQNGVMIEYWQISAAGREVLAKAAAASTGTCRHTSRRSCFGLAAR